MCDFRIKLLQKCKKYSIIKLLIQIPMSVRTYRLAMYCILRCTAEGSEIICSARLSSMYWKKRMSAHFDRHNIIHLLWSRSFRSQGRASVKDIMKRRKQYV